ncbi:hypothetical protein DV452_004812 [Geotrichum candidum]|nr:hypothetical protein DV452_004812 [Geotrichum candidum]KAI8135171.1 hypothetical protein DUD61_001158 [Geotrichum candidum]KAI9213685.1 hypothetical protein DS838_001473 [Geotrichum bryndzae]
MPIKHCVFFKYKADIDPVAKEQITTKLLDLQKLCLDPTTKETYIRPGAITIGGNVSTENLGKGYDLGFVIDFDTFEQSEYYAHKDPAHDAYKAFVGPLVADAFVFDIKA